MLFDGKTTLIPLKDVQYVQKHNGGLVIILPGTTWNTESKSWNNSAYLSSEEAEEFLESWRSFLGETKI